MAPDKERRAVMERDWEVDQRPVDTDRWVLEVCDFCGTATTQNFGVACDCPNKRVVEVQPVTDSASDGQELVGALAQALVDLIAEVKRIDATLERDHGFQVAVQQATDVLNTAQSRASTEFSASPTDAEREREAWAETVRRANQARKEVQAEAAALREHVEGAVETLRVNGYTDERTPLGAIYCGLHAALAASKGEGG